MVFPLILGIVLGALLVVFALQNVAVVTLSFFTWQFQGSLALVLILAAAAGVVVSLLIVLPESIASYFSYRSLKKTNARLEEELRKQKELTAFAKGSSATAEELAKLDQGRIANPEL